TDHCIASRVTPFYGGMQDVIRIEPPQIQVFAAIASVLHLGDLPRQRGLRVVDRSGRLELDVTTEETVAQFLAHRLWQTIQERRNKRQPRYPLPIGASNIASHGDSGWRGRRCGMLPRTQGR